MNQEWDGKSTSSHQEGEGTAPQQRGNPEGKGQEETPADTLFYWLNTATTIMVVMVLVFTFLGRLTRVDGESMENTLQHGQLLLVRSFAYTPQRGDIVVVNKTTVPHLDRRAIVKRVIAIGGDQVDLDYGANQVYVNGVALEEPYIKEAMWDLTGDFLFQETHFQVPEGSIFVMGDNRNHSDDSRDRRIGMIDQNYVLGGAFFSIWPLNTWGPM